MPVPGDALGGILGRLGWGEAHADNGGGRRDGRAVAEVGVEECLIGKVALG